MRIAVITGGPIYPEASFIARAADSVYCADSGLDYCLANGIKPDLFFGDRDSVSDEGLNYLKVSNIPQKFFSSDKDKTDTELALESCPEGSSIDLICSLEGRIDHVLANLGLLFKFKESGYDITATDGVTDVIPVISGSTVALEGVRSGDTAVSLVPFAGSVVTGVTTEGLKYQLSDASLYPTSSLSISNEPGNDSSSFKVTVGDGRLLIVLTKAV